MKEMLIKEVIYSFNKNQTNSCTFFYCLLWHDYEIKLKRALCFLQFQLMRWLSFTGFSFIVETIKV